MFLKENYLNDIKVISLLSFVCSLFSFFFLLVVHFSFLQKICLNKSENVPHLVVFSAEYIEKVNSIDIKSVKKRRVREWLTILPIVQRFSYGTEILYVIVFIIILLRT